MLATRRTLILLLAGLGLAVGLLVPVSGDYQVTNAQTIPTRTPTPDPDAPPPPADPPVQPEPPGDPGVQPTAPAEPVVSTATIMPTREVLPTAAACAEPPTAQVADRVNVRSGPGTGYTVLDVLVAGEVRVITGRAGNAAWWLIRLADGREGWIADQLATVHGYTGSVPVIAAPSLNNVTPTPGPTWQPTPNPLCTPPPTATAVATRAMAIQSVTEAEATATATAMAAAMAAATATAAAESESLLAEQPEATATAGTPTPTATVVVVIQGSVPTAVPLDSAGGGGGSGWILLTGLALLLTGGVAYFVLERRSHQGETP
jgi:uncharacterized protein YraI